jgi:xylulokinase
VLWIKNHEPEIYKKTRWFLTSEAYLVYKLTGQATIDIYTASGYAPLFDREKFEWIKEAADLITPIERLPKVYWSHEIVGKVTTEAARETGLEPGTPVVAGTTDAAAESLSAGVSDPGDMMLMMGSSIFFILKSSKLVLSQNFWSANFLEKDSYSFLGAMSTSGSLTTWFRNQFAQDELAAQEKGGEDAYAVLAKAAAQSPAGSNGLILLPYFEGERTPLNDPNAKGVWFGFGLKHTKSDMYRSILEGVAFGIRNNLETMNAEGVYPKCIKAIGGGTKNTLWLQIIADVCNIELEVPQQQIGASYGDAFLAGVGVGLYKDLSEIKHWIRVGQSIHPNKDAHELYEVNYQIFKELYTDTKPLMLKLVNHLKQIGV